MKTFLMIFIIVILLFLAVDAGAAALRESSLAFQQVRQAELRSCVDMMQIYANMEALRINSQLSQFYMQQNREQQSELSMSILWLITVILIMAIAMMAGFFFFLWYTKRHSNSESCRQE